METPLIKVSLLPSQIQYLLELLHADVHRMRGLVEHARTHGERGKLTVADKLTEAGDLADVLLLAMTIGASLAVNEVETIRHAPFIPLEEYGTDDRLLFQAARECVDYSPQSRLALLGGLAHAVADLPVEHFQGLRRQIAELYERVLTAHGKNANPAE